LQNEKGGREMSLEIVGQVDWQMVTQVIDEEFGRGVTKSLTGNLMPVSTKRKRGISYYLVPADWMTFLQSKFEGFEPAHIGQRFGDMVEGRFRFSLSMLDSLKDVTANRIIVTGKGAEAFTYGRSILKESTVEVSPNLVRGQRVIVMNTHGDSLGLASLTMDSERVDRLAPDRLVAKNLADIGWYIRNE
jgi:ribosome biogenesis protein Nip4